MKAVGTMSAEAFRFGDGEVLHSRYRIEFVGTFAGKEVVYGFSVVDGVCPPLFSRSGCTQLGVIIDCEHHTVSSRKLGVKSFGMGRDEGHYTVRIDEFSGGMSTRELPSDFCLPEGTDAMMMLPEVLLETEPEATQCRAPVVDGSSEPGGSASEVQAMQLLGPPNQGMSAAGGDLRGRGVCHGDRPRGGPPTQGQKEPATSGTEERGWETAECACSSDGHRSGFDGGDPGVDGRGAGDGGQAACQASSGQNLRQPSTVRSPGRRRTTRACRKCGAGMWARAGSGGCVSGMVARAGSTSTGGKPDD